GEAARRARAGPRAGRGRTGRGARTLVHGDGRGGDRAALRGGDRGPGGARVKLLFVTARFPWPPDRGDRLTSLALMRVLAREHETTLLSFVDGREPAGACRELEALGIRVETVRLPRARSWAQAWLALAGPEPSQVAYYRSRDMRDRVARHVVEGGYDAVCVMM